MVIVYCEKCGMRVPEDQLQSGLAICSSENRYYCKTCSASMPKSERDHAQPANVAHQTTPVPGALKNRPHVARTAERSAAANKGVDKMWLYGAGVAAVLVLAVFVFSRPRSQPVAPVAKTETSKPPVSTPATTPTTSQPPANSTPFTTATPATPPADDPVKARMRESERQFEQMREQRGMKLLDEAREFNRANPTDPWSYKDQLDKIVSSYRSTPAAEQAAKLLATLKMPDGPRPAPPAPPVAAAAAIPASWTGEPGADGWRPVLDGKSPPFRGTGFGTWKYDNGTLVNTEKCGDQTNFSFGDGEIRMRFQVDNSSWVSLSFHQTDQKSGANLGFDRRVLEPLWGKPLELIVTCRGDDYQAKFNGQPTPINANGCERAGRIHINNAVGTMRIFSIDFRPLP